MNTILKVGSRTSPLALKQVKEIQGLMPSVQLVVMPIETQGDKDKVTPLSEVDNSDFFTREIDQALLRGDIDIAIHSSKDLPDVLPEGLRIIFETKSLSPFDVLIAKGNLKLKDLPLGSRIGVSSLRRKGQVLSFRKDLRIVDIRGNIQERLNLIDENKIDALIVAHAALIRLGLEDKITEILNPIEFPTHPKQGKLAIVVDTRRLSELSRCCVFTQGE